MNKDLLCDSSNSLIEVMRIINKNGKGVCFVIDESKSLKGVVTDGDIRRALLDSIHLDEKVENILSKDFCDLVCLRKWKVQFSKVMSLFTTFATHTAGEVSE